MNRHIYKFGQKLQARYCDAKTSRHFLTGAGCKARSDQNNPNYKAEKPLAFLKFLIDLKR